MSPKFLVDVGVSKKVEQWLNTSGYDVQAVRAINPKLPDHMILQIAAHDDRIVITMDKDFGEMIYRSGQTHAGVLLLRLDEARSDDKVRIVAEIIQNHADKLEGKFAVYQSGRLRIR